MAGTQVAASYPALRASPMVPDSLDPERIALVRSKRWNPQNDLRLPFERQVEEHCRLLAGRQWDVWSEELGKFIDVTAFFSAEEKLFRQRPVVNYLAYWYMLTTARLTENPPIITFQPATSDRADAQLAETLDTIFKTCWADAHATEEMDRLLGWVVATGTAYLKSYPDLTKGAASPRTGPATIAIPHPETGEPVEHELDGEVPYDEDGTPQFEVVPHPETGAPMAVPTAEPAMVKDGQICLGVLNPVQVRGEWNTKPWHEKAWHIHRDYYPTSEVQAQWGVEVPADAPMGATEGPGYLARLLFGSGYYGTAERGGTGIGATSNDPGATGDLVCVDECWEKPSPENGQQGRLLIVTATKVLYDGPRPFPKLVGASPIRQFQFVGLPGRPAGTTPMEFLVPLQRQMNRFWAQAMEHASLMTNPLILEDDAAGLDDEQFAMIPGGKLKGGLRNGQPMVAAFVPPTLSSDFWKIQEMVRDTLMFLGNVTGTEGSAPTDDASGELVAQLRANADRFVGPTARQMVTELARMADDWSAILSVLWTRPKLLMTAGDDNVPMTVAVEPGLWSGNANAVPDVQSMLPESRAAKQNRIRADFAAGLFGPPLDPTVAGQVRELMRYPNLNRQMQPGGVDAITATQAIGKLLLGTPPEQIPLLEPYNLAIWVHTVGQYIAAPEFLANAPNIQQAVLAFWTRCKQAAMQQAVQQAGEAAAVQAQSLGAAAKANPMVAAQADATMAQHDRTANPPDPTHAGPPTAADAPPAHNAPPSALPA